MESNVDGTGKAMLPLNEIGALALVLLETNTSVQGGTQSCVLLPELTTECTEGLEQKGSVCVSSKKILSQNVVNKVMGGIAGLAFFLMILMLLLYYRFVLLHSRVSWPCLLN